ncbi:MAG: hypothetical protein JWL84_5461 [Rhodospirillales bacterium]|jgi:hypothetical protein|nr:hypothetical protein [Rhodospirillales bacterium]
MKIVAVLSLLALSSCGPTLMVVHNPKTGETAQCQTEPHIFSNPAAKCVAAYEKLGWELVQ